MQSLKINYTFTYLHIYSLYMVVCKHLCVRICLLASKQQLIMCAVVISRLIDPKALQLTSSTLW